MDTFDNTGAYRYDYAVAGVPFLSAANADNPFVRVSADTDVRQVLQAQEPGERALQGWWYRSQSSFHGGCGAKFNDVTRDGNLAVRFADSENVEVTVTGEVTLLKVMEQKAVSGTWQDELAGCDNVFMVNHAEGAVLAGRGTAYVRYVYDGGNSAVSGLGSAGNIADIVSNGDIMWVLAENGLYRVEDLGTTVTQIYRGASAGQARRGRMLLAKDRLIVNLGHRVVALNPNASATDYHDGVDWVWPDVVDWDTTDKTPALLDWTDQDSGWAYWGFAEGPAGFYLASNLNELNTTASADFTAPARSVITFVGLDPRSEGVVPDYLPPAIVAELPSGEAVRHISAYMGTYLMVGTSKGLRVAIIAGDGSLVMGPLHDTATGEVGEVTDTWFRGDQVLFGTATATEAGTVGVWRLDLAQPATDGSLRFAVSKANSSGATYASPNRVTDIVRWGQTDRLAFAISSLGTGDSTFWVESDDTYCHDGWLLTSRVRLDTAEDKIFQSLRMQGLPGGGTVTAFWRDEDEAELACGVVLDTETDRVADGAASDGVARPWVQFRFELTAATTDTVSPVFTGYQVKAVPANVKARTIQVPLLCHLFEQPTEGAVVERPVFERVQALEAAEKSGAVVKFQDFGTGEERDCLIERVVFESKQVSNELSERQNPGGILTVRLRTVD